MMQSCCRICLFIIFLIELELGFCHEKNQCIWKTTYTMFSSNLGGLFIKDIMCSICKDRDNILYNYLLDSRQLQAPPLSKNLLLR